MTRDKFEEENASCLLTNLDGETRASCHANYMVGWNLPDEVLDYGAFYKYLVHLYVKTCDPDELFEMPMPARLDEDDLKKPLSALQEIYDKSDSMMKPSTVC